MVFFFDVTTVVLLGLVLGSFATALSYRLPRNLSMVTRVHSQCPSCEHNLACRDLVPVFSWIFLKGRCRYCQAVIGRRYPLIELATLALCLLFYAIYGLKVQTAAIFLLTPFLVSIMDIDLRYKIIPDGLNLIIFLLGVGALAINAGMAPDPGHFIVMRGAAAIGGFLLYGTGSLLLRQSAQIILEREAMGLGDVKFFAVAGFWLGLNAYAAAMLMIVSGLSGIVMAIIWKKRTGESEVPFGPSLIIAFIAVLCVYMPGFMIIH